MAKEQPTPIGVEFTETMTGFFSDAVKDDYATGSKQGKKDGSPFEFTLTIVVDDVDRMITQPDHSAVMSGTVKAPVLSGETLEVPNGKFYLFVDDKESVMTRRMIYKMPVVAKDGRKYFFEGFKVVHHDKPLDMWPDTSTLYITVYDGEDDQAPVVGKGILKIPPTYFMKQLTTMRAVNAPNEVEGLKALTRFGEFFAGVLNEIYGGVVAKANVFNPDAPPREKRPLRMSAPEVHHFETEDGVGLRLTRYEGGSKGPVIVSPGFGTPILAYTIDTTDTNFPESLYEAGYDIWLLDYRASPALPSASDQFTLDDVAKYDYPAAVAYVRKATGAESVQIMAHCVGALTMLMSMTLGLEGVRSAVASQLTLHPVPPTLNKIKSGLHAASALTALGMDTMTTDFTTESGWADKLADKLLRLYPTQERCNNPVCRRILFMYGDVYDHDNLNEATHDAMHEMFGVANMTTFKHLALMLREGHAVSATGEEIYLPNADKIQAKIAFLHGANNHLFLPEGSEKTYTFLRDTNGPDNYVRRVVQDYAHMDCFIGKDAAKDVYPVVIEELDKFN